jgi:hypothetical protein
VDQAFDAVFQLHECTVVGDVGDRPFRRVPTGYLASTPSHGSAFELLHAEADALGFRVDLDDLDFDRLADIDKPGGRVVDALPRHVGDVQQAIDAAQIDERTVVGDVLDHAFAHLAFFISPRFPRAVRRGSLPGSHGARPRCCRGAVHLEDLRRAASFISGPTSRTGRMSTCEPGRKALTPPRSTVKPPLTRPEIAAPLTRSFALNSFLERNPGSSRRALSRRQDSFAQGVFDTKIIEDIPLCA